MKIALDKKFFADRRIRLGYLLVFILLITSYFFIFFMNGQIQKQADSIVHTNSVIMQAGVLLSDVIDAETGLRGYLIMKDKEFLQPFNGSPKRISTAIAQLRTLTIDNPEQQKRIDTLNRIVVKRIAIINSCLIVFENSNQLITDSLKMLIYSGMQVMNKIRDCVQRVKNTEQNLLQSRTSDLIAYKSAVRVINITSLVIAFLFLAYAIFTYYRENTLKKQADKAALLYAQELEKSVKELKEANTELIELRRNEKFAVTGRIARTIAHEVKNPLTNINLAAEQLKEVVSPDDETNMLFDMITRNGNRINQLVSDLLNSTKISELKFENVSANELLDEALYMAKDRIELNNVKVEKEYNAQLSTVLVDKEQIKIALLNLIVNAIEATEQGKGILNIRTGNKNNKCVVIIADNGVGMKKDDLLKLFEPYFTNKPKGTGLGLTHTQSIILNHKGSINVESEPGKGTKFEVILDFA